MTEDGAKEATSYISGDRPIEDPADDRLGFARFAEGLARSLLAQTTSQGLVVGIHGPWGSGKTTLLNFVLHYLDEMTQSSKTAPEGADATQGGNPNLLIVRFNPWWFTGREDLAVRLLDQFRASLAGEGERASRIKDSLGELSESLSSSPFGVLQKAGFFGRLAFKRNPDVVKLKKKIADALVEDGRLVVFVVDDIDRLNAEELRHLFGVIKAVGDFPARVSVAIRAGEAATPWPS
jgi:predicted KAP-like P-loop ATPase